MFWRAGRLAKESGCFGRAASKLLMRCDRFYFFFGFKGRRAHQNHYVSWFKLIAAAPSERHRAISSLRFSLKAYISLFSFLPASPARSCLHFIRPTSASCSRIYSYNFRLSELHFYIWKICHKLLLNFSGASIRFTGIKLIR